MNTNVDSAEIARFDALAGGWWNAEGDMGPLHVINPVRTRYIKERVQGLRGKRVLDVGCGGGILAESLAREGASVLGIDLAAASIAVASQHAAVSGLDVRYQEVSAEELAENPSETFDVVCCLEMLEHVPDPAQTIAACAQLTKPGGHVVFSTINRNPKSYALMILAAENVLGLLPKGTHEYAKFIRPSELDRWARAADLEPADLIGMSYNPILKRAALNARDLDVNYLMHCRRPL